MPTPHMQLDDLIFIAGHRGLVGSAVCRELERLGYTHLLTRTHAELDLADAGATDAFFAEHRPRFAFLAAAKVGGILANTSFPADFLRENLLIQNNVLDAARRCGVDRLLFLGSSCIYPRLAPQPMPESCMLTGPLEPTNRPYALAKIAGVELCWSSNRQYGTRFLAAMPSNLYGPGDNFDLKSSHVIPALMRKTVAALRSGAPTLEVWGSGKPRREFLYSDDAAQGCIFLMNLDDDRLATLLNDREPPLVNVGSGLDITIRDLAEHISRTLGFTGALVFDAGKPDGTPQKLLDVTRIHGLGWHHQVPLEEGLARTWRLVKDTVFAESAPRPH